MGLFGLNAAWAERRFETRDRAQDSAVWAKKKVTGLLVKQLTRPDALLIVVDTQMDAVTPDHSMSPPDVFYFGDRRGWYISMAWLTETGIEHLRDQGAQYVVVSGQSVDDFRDRRAGLLKELRRRYPAVLDDDRGLIFDLGARLSSTNSPLRGSCFQTNQGGVARVVEVVQPLLVLAVSMQRPEAVVLVGEQLPVPTRRWKGSWTSSSPGCM